MSDLIEDNVDLASQKNEYEKQKPPAESEWQNQDKAPESSSSSEADDGEQADSGAESGPEANQDKERGQMPAKGRSADQPPVPISEQLRVSALDATLGAGEEKAAGQNAFGRASKNN